MASTNKTTNYNLSQFIGSDKPAWLSDYNQDMSKIDTAIKSASDTATSAVGEATSAATAIGNLPDLTTENKTNVVSAINEVDTHADTAQNTATQAVASAEANTTKLSTLESYLNLNNFTTPSVTVSGGTASSDNTSLNCATNFNGSLGKIYGRIMITAASSNVTITFPTPLRPSSTLTINGIALTSWSDTPSNQGSYSVPSSTSVIIDTNGTATLNVRNTISGRGHRINIMACLLFMKSFGDVIISD